MVRHFEVSIGTTYYRKATTCPVTNENILYLPQLEFVLEPYEMKVLEEEFLYQPL